MKLFANSNIFFSQAHKERILIKGGMVVNEDQMLEADVFIESGIIKYVSCTCICSCT